MKTLVVLSALAAIATAGPALPDDITDYKISQNLKRSPSLGLHGSHHHVATPIHPLPVVHHTYVQPVIPHHLGLKKPLLFKHHGHHYRADDEQVEAHSTKSKESKNQCLKEMEAKCDDGLVGKSSELTDGSTVDADEQITESEVAESLKMAKEAVDTLQKKLQRAEKSSRMSGQWKHGESESDVKLHENIETAKQALDHMNLNFGKVESMNVHATTFKEAEVHNVHLQLGNSDQERLAQWKDAIDNIQKNVELVRNIEDSFQHNDNTEMKSAAIENSSSLKMSKNVEQKSLDAPVLNKENISRKRAPEMEILGKSTEEKSSLKTLDHQSQQIQSSALKNDIDSSASSISELKANEHHHHHHNINEHHEKSSRSESIQSHQSHLSDNQETNHIAEQHFHQKNSNFESTQLGSDASLNKKSMSNGDIKTFRDDEHSMKTNENKMIAKSMEPASLVNTMKSSESLDSKITHLDHEKSVPIVDTTTLMKSAEQRILPEMTLNSEKLEKTAWKANEQLQSKPDMIIKKGTDVMSLTSGNHDDNGHNLMKPSDQMEGQSQTSQVAVKLVRPMASENLEKPSHLSTQGKSVESGKALLPDIHMGLSTGFKSLDAAKTQSLKEGPRHGLSRGAYGSGLALGGGYGGGAGYGSGSGSGSGAVGVFPNAHVGGCAIPLLLSCSPSVVSGSLAKAHSYSAPSYGAPAYRGSEQTSTHMKRDITKIGIPSKRTLFKSYKSKPILVSDKL